jgi:pilus assembly protein CpaE
VVSANAGSGVTTVSSSLAFALGEQYPGRVLLAEIGTGVPELAIDLDIKAPYGVAELLRDRERMDSAMLRQTAVAHPGGVNILAYTAETLMPTPIDPATMRRLLVLFRSAYDFSVLDLGHGLSTSAHEAMQLAEAVVVVTRLDVPSLRLGRKYCRQLTKDGIPGEKLQIVANRYNQRGLVPWREVSTVLGLPVQAWVPDDPGTVNRALREGQPLRLASRRASITTSFAKLAKALNGVPAK